MPLHATLNGLVEEVPTSEPFAKNATCVTVPSLSAAFALIVTVADALKLASTAGPVRLTVGFWLAATVRSISADVDVAPSLSVATAVTWYVPAVTPFQDTLYGLVVSAPTSVPLAKKATWVTVPSSSLAVASIVMSAGDLIVPVEDRKRLTAGALFFVTEKWTSGDVAMPYRSSTA